jgi:hypothetical protein
VKVPSFGKRRLFEEGASFWKAQIFMESPKFITEAHFLKKWAMFMKADFI